MNDNVNCESSNQNTISSASSLVAMANCGTRSVESYISRNDIILHILLARFMSKISRYQRHDLCEILKLIKKRYCNSNTNGCDIINDEIVIDIPTDDASIRKRYLTGKNSIIKNIPKPKVMVVDKHSYVSIKECLSNYLILNRIPTLIPTLYKNDKMIECITQSNVAKQIYRTGLKVNNKVPQDERGVSYGDNPVWV